MGRSAMDDSAADHEFNPRTASPALNRAMSDLAKKSGRPESEFLDIRLGDAYHLARETYGADMPEFWKVWNSWNDAPEDPAPWGDL